MDEEFQPGDVVKLKSGSQKMVIASVDDIGVWVMLSLHGTHEIKSYRLLRTVLEHAE